MRPGAQSAKADLVPFQPRVSNPGNGGRRCATNLPGPGEACERVSAKADCVPL
jgi:hypothetical protein